MIVDCFDRLQRFRTHRTQSTDVEYQYASPAKAAEPIDMPSQVSRVQIADSGGPKEPRMLITWGLDPPREGVIFFLGGGGRR